MEVVMENVEFTYVDSVRARVGESLWAEVVEAVADWFDHVPAVVAHPWDVNELKKAWLEEMQS
jgi:hypothetical protein